MPLPTVSRKVSELESHLKARLLVRSTRKLALTGALAIVLKRFEPPPLPVSLLYIRETRLTAKLRAFIDFSAPRLRARLSGAPG
jgi:DNA-binding transcriptional LysR family regulator